MGTSFDAQTLRLSSARPFGVSPSVHEADHLWHSVLQHPTFTGPEAATAYYFSDGATSAHKLEGVVQRNLATTSGSPRTLLEFASGYGMVTRHLTRVLGNVELTCCDIHQEAVTFIREDLGAHAVLSRHLPEEVTFEQPFDVVFALSFFSHMPETTFGRWLEALFRAVAPGGILVFTTHGLASRVNFGDITIPESGFWFKPESEQDDLDPAEYGSSLTTPAYVVRELSKMRDASLIEFQAAFWWAHQDLYVVRRPAS